jgi:hypothetical protein
MWRHYCPIEKTWISVGKGEPCNWCDTPEASDDPPDEPVADNLHFEAGHFLIAHRRFRNSNSDSE